MDIKVADELPSSQWVIQPENKAWENVCHLGREKIYKAKDSVCRPGDPVLGVMALKSGVLQLLAIGPDGHQRTLWFMGPGGVLGDAALFYGRPYMHYGIAVQDCCFVEFSKEVLLEHIIPEYPEVCLALFKNLSMKSYIMSTQLEELSFQSSGKRLARFLYQHALIDENGLAKLTQRSVAGLLGMHRVTVSKLISQFKKQGILSASRRGLYVKDLHKLEELI